MIKKTGLLFALICFVAIGFGQSKSDQDEIKSCFASYKASLLESNGKETIKQVDQTTFKYYERILKTCISGDSVSVEALPLLDKITVLALRHRINKEEILKMDASSLLEYSINSGMVGKNSVMNIELGDVEVSGKFAKGQVITNGKAAPLFFHFNQEGNQWKIDITSIFKPSQMALQKMIKGMGQSENQFVINMLQMATGKSVKNSIWQPLK
jgi:hypothetical protein